MTSNALASRRPSPPRLAALASAAGLGYLPRQVRPRQRPRARVFLVCLADPPRRTSLEMQGDQEDRRQLIEPHHKRLVGWFRARVGARDVAEDLAQRTWVEVLRRLDSFDPAKGSFWTFTRIWADFVRQRYWDECRRAPLPLDGSAPGEEDDGGSDIPSEGTAVEDLIDSPEVFTDLLRRTLDCRRLPHEIIAFGFVKLLEWKPQRVVAELSHSSLEQAIEILEREYSREAPLPDVPNAFRLLREKLSLPLGACDADKRTKERYDHLLARPVGSTSLCDYYPGEGRNEDAVVRWWAAVGRSVKEDILRQRGGRLAEWIDVRRENASRPQDRTPR